MTETSSSRIAALLVLLAFVSVCISCESGSSRDLTLARAAIARLKEAVVYSDHLALAELLSDSALGHYELAGKGEWETLLEDVSCADRALRNVIRISGDEGNIAIVGWSGKYHIVLRIPIFQRKIDGRLVFDGLADARILATNRTAATSYLDRMRDAEFRDLFFSHGGLHLPFESGLMLQADPQEMEILPSGFDPDWLFAEEMAFLRSVADTLEQINQEFTAAASRWELEAMAQRGTELVLLRRAMAHDRVANERLVSLYARRGAEMAKAWEKVKSQYYQMEQDDPRFVMDVGDTLDRFMSLAETFQSYPAAKPVTASYREN